MIVLILEIDNVIFNMFSCRNPFMGIQTNMISTTAWPVYTNANLFFDKKKKKELANIRPSLHFYDMI